MSGIYKRNEGIFGYKYYDTPEGKDIDKKAFVCAKYGAAAGVILSTADVLMYSHATGWGPILKRYTYHTLPLAMIGATFAVVSNSVMHMREKNDALNYFIGGLACGPILAAYLGSMHALMLGGLALGLAGAVKKDAVDHNFTLFPMVTGHMGTVRRWRHDYTLTEDPRKEQPKAPQVCARNLPPCEH